MTLSERNLILDLLTELAVIHQVTGTSRERITEIHSAIHVMQHQEIKGRGLPVSAGGKDE